MIVIGGSKMKLYPKFLVAGVLLTAAGLVLPTTFAFAAGSKTELSQGGDSAKKRLRYSKNPELIGKIAIPKNPKADTHHCCGAGGCYPAPNNHPWNCGNAPIVVWCTDTGICTPQ